MVEIFVMRDRRTGESKGCAFVKYADESGAKAAIAGLNGKFMGGANPLRVQWAEGESNSPQDTKLFVGMVPFEATEDDIRAVFSPYGRVTEVFIMRKHDGSSKGCAFVKFGARAECDKAIAALHHQSQMLNRWRCLDG